MSRTDAVAVVGDEPLTAGRLRDDCLLYLGSSKSPRWAAAVWAWIRSNLYSQSVETVSS